MHRLPEWRIACFFVGRTHRHRGWPTPLCVVRWTRSPRLGGGLVESYPEEAGGRKASSSFLNNATVSFFERHGFERHGFERHGFERHGFERHGFERDRQKGNFPSVLD